MNSRLLISLLLFSGLATAQTQGPSRIELQSLVYPSPAGLAPSRDYQVEVDGKKAFVYSSPVPAAYCSFEFHGPTVITIKANRDIQWVDVRPLSAGIQATFQDSTISIRLTKPAQLSIELNGSRRTPLFLFANAPERNKPDRQDKNTIWFAAGKIYHPGIIELKSDQTLYIEAGAVVVGVVRANQAKHIRVCGRGVLDGSLNNHFPAGDSTAYQRFLEFRDCEDVRLEDLTLHNSTSWQVVPIHCNHVDIENLKIVSDQNSDDGMDIVRSRNVRISGCFVRTKDDCIAVKSNFDYPASEGVEHVQVQNCVFWNGAWGNGLEIGFELNSAEVRDIVFRDNDIIHIEDGAAISIHNAGRATVRHVLYDDIRIEDANQKLFDLAIFRSKYSDDAGKNAEENKRLYLNGAWDGVLAVPAAEKEAHAAFRGRIEDIVFRNIRVIDGLFPYSVFHGYDKTHSIRDVRIENLVVHGEPIRSPQDARVRLENAENVSIVGAAVAPGVDVITADTTAPDAEGFTPIFDGKTLNNWKGDSTYWRVEDGCLLGVVTPETLLKRNSFIIYQGEMPENFEIKVEFKVSSRGNSGINYRSELIEGQPWAMRGYQADLNGTMEYTGSNYEERRRTTLASRGQIVVIPPIPAGSSDQTFAGGKTDSLQTHIKDNMWLPKIVTGSLGDPAQLRAAIKVDDWNEYHIVVRGNRMQHYVNGILMSDVTDNDTVNRRFTGLMGVQVHVGPPMRIAYRNFRLKRLMIDSGHFTIHGDSLPVKKAEEIQQLIDKARPGDTVFVEEGVYKLSHRPIQPVVSGRKDAWITIMPSGGKRVIIDGSDYLSSYDTTKQLPRTGSITFANCRYIRMEGIETRQSHNAGIIIEGASTDHIEIINCKSTGSYNSGIAIWYADSCKILHCEVTGANDQALRPRGVPLGREAPHEAISLAGASHFEVGFNLVHDCFKEGIDCKEVSNHGVIHHNTIYNMPRQGLYTDCWFGRLSNVEFHHNIVHHCEWGFGISGEGRNASMDSIFFHHNLLYDNRASGIFFSIWGSDEPRRNIFIYNNTLFNNGTAGHWSGLTGGIEIMSSNLKNVFIYNNIISKNYGYAIGAFSDNSEKDSAFKNRNIKILHNLEWQVGIPGKELPRSNFRTIHPIEGQSAIKADPLFMDAGAGDFRLSVSSPAFNKGWRDAPSGKTNYLGAISPYQ